MAVLRDTNIDENVQNYVATIGFFCVISCTVLMLRFRGFKASINLLSGRRETTEYYEDVPIVSITGAYRINREEFYGNDKLNDTPKKNLSPSMVKLPPSSQPDPTERPVELRQTKSTGNLIETSNLPPTLQKSTPDISFDPRGRTSNNNRDSTDARKISQKDGKKHDKEQKRLEKKQQDEQKKRDKIAGQERAKQGKLAAQEQAKQKKLAAQEQAKQEKLRKEREKVEAQQRAKEAKRLEKENKAKAKADKQNKTNKNNAPKPRANPLAQGPRANPHAQGPSNVQTQPPQTQYATNTLESSISKTSGPPPYVEPKAMPRPSVVQNNNDGTGNTSFSKPVDGGSWDLISQHRQQINRPVNASSLLGGRPKQMVLDLQYNVGTPAASSEGKGNSDA